tara:strand:+ start:351 stop:737 length:387 start_codon:yes stop_codon:yes gene_type:complete
MKSLLLVAHGSRRVASNDEVRELTKTLEKKSGSEYGFVDCCFLELAEPSIPEGIQRCIDAGASEVIVLPYFLSAGRHVFEDIPTEVKIKQDEYPEVKICISNYLGTSQGITDLLLSAAQTESSLHQAS